MWMSVKDLDKSTGLGQHGAGKHSVIDKSNPETRYVMTPDGKGYMFSADDKDLSKAKTVTVHFSGKGAGKNKVYSIEEVEEIA